MIALKENETVDKVIESLKDGNDDIADKAIRNLLESVSKSMWNDFPDKFKGLQGNLQKIRNSNELSRKELAKFEELYAKKVKSMLVNFNNTGLSKSLPDMNRLLSSVALSNIGDLMQELNQQLDGNQINSYKSIEKYYDKQMLEQMTKEFGLSKETAEVAVKNGIYVKEISNGNFELLSNYNGVVFSKGGDLQNAKNYGGRVSFSKASPNDRLWFGIQGNFFVVVDESTKDQMTIKLDK